MALDVEATVKCSRCNAETLESDLLPVHNWWFCGKCYDQEPDGY